jgi:hypothetical protein
MVQDNFLDADFHFIKTGAVLNISPNSSYAKYFPMILYQNNLRFQVEGKARLLLAQREFLLEFDNFFLPVGEIGFQFLQVFPSLGFVPQGDFGFG